MTYNKVSECALEYLNPNSTPRQNENISSYLLFLTKTIFSTPLVALLLTEMIVAKNMPFTYKLQNINRQTVQPLGKKEVVKLCE